jgi:ribosomal protein L22
MIAAYEGVIMKIKPFSRLFKKKRKRGWKQNGTQMIRVSDGSCITIKATAREYGMTMIAAHDLICVKAIEKLVEEQKEKGLSQREMQLYVTQLVVNQGFKAKRYRQNTIPKKESPGETPGAAGS